MRLLYHGGRRNVKTAYPTMFLPKKQERTDFLSVRSCLLRIAVLPGVMLGEGDVGAEQVAVDGQMECTAHELHQTAGYGQAQAAALCVWREASPRTKRSISSSGEMFSSARETFLKLMVTCSSSQAATA